MKQRSVILFEESIKSKYTKKNYHSHLKQFMKFIKIDYMNTLLRYSSSELQQELGNYLIELKQTTNPNTVPSKFKGIKHFCIMNEIDINWQIIYKMFPQKQKPQSLRAYTTKEVREILFNSTNLRNKALIHFLASTGARIGVFDHDLSIKHIKQISYGCNAVKIYAESVEEYWVFLTPQASKILNTYHKQRKLCGERFNEDTPIFTIKDTSKQLGCDGAYDSNDNFKECEKQNIIPAIPVRKNFSGKSNGSIARKQQSRQIYAGCIDLDSDISCGGINSIILIHTNDVSLENKAYIWYPYANIFGYVVHLAVWDTHFGHSTVSTEVQIIPLAGQIRYWSEICSVNDVEHDSITYHQSSTEKAYRGIGNQYYNESYDESYDGNATVLGSSWLPACTNISHYVSNMALDGQR